MKTQYPMIPFPQKKGLKIYINMKFDEIDDPSKIGRDVTDIGTWGNGDMEIIVGNDDEIPYLLDIIEQSYDRQI